MIEIIGTGLNQWDTGRSVKVTDASHVHFANQGDSKAVIMELVDSQALIPNYLLQTGKQLCVYAVKGGVTIERAVFSVKKRERPENYVYDDDQRNYIYELITSAEEAVEDANIAIQNANEAADRANKAADSWLMIGDAKGESVSFNDAMTQPFAGLRIFGKTTQAGTPTPDAPVELVSVGDSGSITVNVAGANEANSMTVATPNGLPGIPVASGGNYIDANGQRWICDEIDLARGVYVRRVYQETVAINSFRKSSQTQTTKYYLTAKYASTGLTKALCSIMGQDKYAYHVLDVEHWYIDSGFNVFIPNSEISTFESLGSVTVVYDLTTPIETHLSSEELAAYAALHTYRKNTTVSNDASAYMELEYVVDAKKYIDNLVITGGGSVARLSTVTLSASKWAGENSLYSQVVTIDGITENSKVDLLPSVEQLAIFHNKDVAFVTENEDGVVTVYAIGEKPLLDYTMQVQITEVLV